MQDERETAFSQKDILPRYVFCFFSSRKEIVPPSFLFRRKNGQLAREAQPLRRTSSFLFRRKEAKENQLRLSFFSVLLLLSPTCNTKRASSFLFRRKEAKENHLRKSYYSALLPFQPTCHAKRTVHIRTVRFFVPYAGRAGNRLFSERHPSPQCLLFLFFKKRKRPPL